MPPNIPQVRTTLKSLIVGFTFLFFFLLINVGSAQNHVYLTLEESLHRALSYNRQIQASHFGLMKAKWDQRYAWTLLLPTLDFNTRYMRIDETSFQLRDFFRQNIRIFFPNLPPDFEIPPSAYRDAYYSSLDVSLTLFNGALLNGLAIASANKRMAKNLNKSTQDNIAFQVISSYLNILKTNAILHLQKEYLDLSRLNYEKADRLFKAGRYSKTEALRWQVDFQQQKSVVVNNESLLRTAKTILNRLLDFDMNQTIEVDQDLPLNLLSESQKLRDFSDEQILELIRLSNEQVINANAALAASKENEKVNKLLYRNSYTNFMPNVSLSYSHAWRENNTLALDDFSPKTLMINFSLPLFTSFQNLTSTKSAYYDYKRSKEQFADDLQNTHYVLTETANKLINLKTQISLTETNVTFNENNYRVVAQQKDDGRVSNIDFIDAKLNLQNAKLDQINNQYDFISAMVELYYLIGKIDMLIN
jgi:outer membrane protein TolC